MQGLFVTAVGTGIGKTLVTAILCHQLTSVGRPVRAIKPVVSGFSPDDPASDPALILRSLGQTPCAQSIAVMTPWRFAAPMSPHLAARIEGRSLNIEEIAAFCREQNSAGDGHLLIEGAGGVMTPINDTQTVLDLAELLAHPIILVAGSYLGTISHTLTALVAIRGRGLVVAGIVVSESEDDAGMTETIASLRQFAGADIPLFGLPRLAGSDEEKWLGAPCLTTLCGVADV